MRTTQNVGNNGAVNYSQYINALKKGAHGRQIRKLMRQATGASNHSYPNGMYRFRKMRRSSTGQLQDSVTGVGKGQMKLIESADCGRIKETITELNANKEINDVPHPEAVKATNDIIIKVLTKIMETGFSVEKIEEAIEEAGAKDYTREEDPSTAEAKAHENGGPVLEKYNKYFHGGAYREKADQDLSAKYGRDLNTGRCIPGALRGNQPTQIKENDPKLEDIGLSTSESTKYSPNNWSQEIDDLVSCFNINKALLIKMDSGDEVPPNDWKILQVITIATPEKVYSKDEKASFIQDLKEAIKKQEEIIDKQKKEYLKNKIKTSEDIIKQYSNQLIREYNTFSGDIEIKKLESGTVLVRDFGQSQSVKGSCWCLAADLNSAVNCDKDLQTRLAVKPSWNGGGNRAVFVVPQEPPSIYVAVGTIAQQKNDNDYENTVYHSGGGIQYNILTPNDCDVNSIKNASGGFANAGKAFDKCCFVITNTGVIEANDRKTLPPKQPQGDMNAK